jgi:hypothetical protein
MRKHRIYGVVIAVLLGTSLLHQRPSSHHQQHRRHVAGTGISRTGIGRTGIGRTGIRLASATVSPTSPHIGHLWPAGADLGRIAVRLAAATTSATGSATGQAQGSYADLLRPGRARYMEALLALNAFYEAHPPPPPAAIPRALTKPALTHLASTPHHVATPSAPATRAAGDDVWAGLRRCESDGNYSDNTGNGYYGAYQFSLGTWRGLGLAGLPSAASPDVQDQAARQLQARSGWGQWPSCSRRLRLT